MDLSCYLDNYRKITGSPLVYPQTVCLFFVQTVYCLVGKVIHMREIQSRGATLGGILEAIDMLI